MEVVPAGLVSLTFRFHQLAAVSLDRSWQHYPPSLKTLEIYGGIAGDDPEDWKLLPRGLETFWVSQGIFYH